MESMIEICRDHSRNVTRWESGTMALRWCAASLAEAKKQFRRVNGHIHLTALRARPRGRRRPPPARRPLQYESHTPQLRSACGLNRPPTVTEVPRNSGHPPRTPLSYYY